MFVLLIKSLVILMILLVMCPIDGVSLLAHSIVAVVVVSVTLATTVGLMVRLRASSIKISKLIYALIVLCVLAAGLLGVLLIKWKAQKSKNGVHHQPGPV